MTNYLILICITAIMISLIKEGNLYNPTFIFSMIWGLIFLIYKYNPYDISEASNDTLLCFGIGIGCFLIGTLLLGDIEYTRNSCRYIRRKKGVPGRTYIDNYYENKKAIIIMQMIGVAIFAYLGSHGVLSILSGNSISYIRYYLRLQILDSRINGMLITYIAEPILYFSLTYSAAKIGIHAFDKYTSISLLLSIFMLIMELLTTGGRMGILYTMVCVFVSAVTYQKYSWDNHKKTRIFILAGMLLLGGIYAMYGIALERGDNTFVNTVVYLYGPVGCFENYKSTFLENNYSFTWGLLSTQGFTRPVLKLFGLSNCRFVENVNQAYALIDSETYLNHHRFNSATSCFGYFYFDFGKIGIAVFSLLFGFICQKYYRKFFTLKEVRLSYLCLYILMTGAVALSFIQFSFASIGFALSMCLMILLSKLRIRQ